MLTFASRRFPRRLKVRCEAKFLTDEAREFVDRTWVEDGTLVDERHVYCTLVAPDRVRVLSDRRPRCRGLDGTLVNRLPISWFGLPVARVELRARPQPT